MYGIQLAQPTGGLGTAWEIWKHRKWLAIFVFLPLCTVGMSVTMLLPATYQSTATILIERRQVPDTFVQSTITGGMDYRVQTITQVALSRSRLESLIERFNLYQDLRWRLSPEQVIERMRKDILLKQTGGEKGGQGDSISALAISYKGRDPQQVAEVANTIASFYIDENLKAREQQAVETADFLRGQLEEMKQRQEEEQQHLHQFKERYMGELPEQLQSNLKALDNLNAQLRLNGEKEGKASERREALAQQLAELAGLKVPSKHTIVVASDPQLNIHVTQLEKLQQELTKLSRRYGEKHPTMVSLTAQIEALDQLIAQKNTTNNADDKKKQEQAIKALQNPYAQQLKKELDTLEAELKVLRTEKQDIRQSIALYQQRVENTPVREQELQVLQRDYDSAQGLYQSLLKRQEEAKLAESLEQRQKGEQFRLIESALPQVQSKDPDRRKLILMSLAGALGLAAGAVILVEKLHPSFHTVDDLHAFSQVPVLVSLPYIVTRADIRRRRWRSGLLALSVILSLSLIVASYVVSKGPERLAALFAQPAAAPAQVNGIEK
jgi:polysaccharide chain length determinant protein (PEP-CTERM system associated)